MSRHYLLFLNLAIVSIVIIGCKTKTETFEQIPSSKVLSKIDSVQTRHEIFGFGEAIPKTAQFGKFGKFQSYEVYEDATSGKLINGVERFGPYRLYTHQGSDSDTNYTGPPRIEFLSKDGSISNVALPIYMLSIFNESKPNLENTPDRSPNAYHISLDEIPNLIDTLSVNVLGKDHKMTLRFEYDIQNAYLLVVSSYHIFEEITSRGYEVFVFDSLGFVIGHNSGLGSPNIVDLTSNGQYLYSIPPTNYILI